MPELSCSLPSCNQTMRSGKLRVLTNGGSREWVGYMSFDLADLALRPGARVVDAELQLHGTGLCHRRAKWGNFTHQLHVLRAQQTPAALALNRPYPRRLAAQWSRMQVADNFHIPLSLDGKQLLTLVRQRRLNLLVSEKIFGRARRHRNKTVEQTCSYYSSTTPKGIAVWPKLHLSFAWDCCTNASDASVRGGMHMREAHPGDPSTVRDASTRDLGASSARGASGDAPRPPWITQLDWARQAKRSHLPLHWHSSLPGNVPDWVFDHPNDAAVEACTPPHGTADARGGQVGVPSGEAPVVSVVIAYHNNENMTAQCMEQLWACASELPSAEYLFVDDGSDEETGALSALLRRLARAYGIRYELVRYPVSVGFTMATSEAARRANGTRLLFLNNDAFVMQHALR